LYTIDVIRDNNQTPTTMAIFRSSNVDNETITTHEGKVVSTYSNGTYNDDYHYAVVYELDENDEPIYSNVMYHTTAFATNGGAVIDAPEWVLEDYDSLLSQINREKAEQAYRNDVRRGNTVRVVRGRKIPKGTIAEVFWVGKTRFGTSVGLVTFFR
jgi:hypothetical protein